MTMKRLIVLLCLFCVTHLVNAAISEKQMKATKKLVRNTCINKSKIPIEDVDAMQQGDFSKGGCYLLCILETYKVIKGNDYDWEGAVAAIKANAPTNIAEDAIKAVVACKDSMKTKSDKCIGAAEIGKCVYDFAPEKYFLP
uniref:Odorant binding protein 1 n=1 Tax=Callosobruchus chinensis TaxID=146774 RepID=A0A7D6LHU1_CALCS|nr:odorant binding protein 1 [Callosobruchus chinensis]